MQPESVCIAQLAEPHHELLDCLLMRAPVVNRRTEMIRGYKSAGDDDVKILRQACSPLEDAFGRLLHIGFGVRSIVCTSVVRNSEHIGFCPCSQLLPRQHRERCQRLLSRYAPGPRHLAIGSPVARIRLAQLVHFQHGVSARWCSRQSGGHRRR